MTINTRFAPSPTGDLHIGSVRTALFSWLYAKHHGGNFFLRIEDTDRERSTEHSIQVIVDSMQWLGLDYDHPPVYQTQNFDRYQAVAQQLLDEGKAYYCYCSKERVQTIREQAKARGDKPKYDGHCREAKASPPPAGIDSVIRFKNPLSGKVVFEDRIQGKITFQNHELDDLIIARADKTPTYNLTVVVDDLDMQISHVIRGDDHLNNTPRQINIFRALEAEPPQYAHIPLILANDGRRLSKRYQDASVLEYRRQGYLPEALLNYLVRLGWSHGDQEIFSMKEMIEYFDLDKVNKSAASMNADKLLWLNQQYIKASDNQRLAKLLPSYLTTINIKMNDTIDMETLAEAQKQRCKTLLEMAEASQCFFSDLKTYDTKIADKHLHPAMLEPLSYLHKKLNALQAWNKENIHSAIVETVANFDIKFGKIAQPLRVAVTGNTVSPTIDLTLYLMGQEKSLTRINLALQYIRQAMDDG